MVRGQLPYLEEHIARKKEIYERYCEGFRDLPVKMNPFDAEKMQPNYWLSCILVDEEAMCSQTRSATDVSYISESGKSCPSEILEMLNRYNAEGRPIWKPMHMQPYYKECPFVTREGAGDGSIDVGADIFQRGLCLPSDVKMTREEQEAVIAVVRRCFD